MNRNTFLIIYSILLNPLLYGSLDIKFFDVGSGNCTLIKPSDPSTPMLLIDCGSSSLQHRTLMTRGANNRFMKGEEKIATKLAREKKIKEITEEIKTQYVKSGQKQELIIVVSHADEDHYNWIHDIIKDCFGRGPDNIPGEPALILVGGRKKSFATDKSRYGGSKYGMAEFRRYLDENGYDDATETLTRAKYNTHVQLPAHFTWAKTNAYSIGYFLFPQQNIPEYTLMPILDCEKTNPGSLVIRISFKGKSCLVMGDAENTTTDHIERYVSQEQIPSDILLVSHHGASKDCNKTDWLQKVSPSIAILSSGVQYRHPREKIVTSLLQICQKSDKFHTIYFGLDKTDIETYDSSAKFEIGYECNYGSLTTDRKVFGTLGHGTITCSISTDTNTPKISIAFSNKFFYDNFPEGKTTAILTRNCQSSDEGKSLIKLENIPLRKTFFSLDNCTFLNLSKLNICPEVINEFVPIFNVEFENVDHLANLLNEILNSRKNLCLKLYLDNNNIGKYSTVINSLENLIRNHIRIIKLSLADNNINNATKLRLKNTFLQNRISFI